MKRIGLAIVAAAGVIGVMGTAAQAQSVEIGVPGVRVDSGYSHRDRDWDRDRGWRRSYNYDRDDTVVVRRHRDRDWDRPRRKVIIERD